MEQGYFADIVINKERLNNGDDVYAVQCTNLGIASQGSTLDEATKNIREAIELYLEEQPDAYNELRVAENPPVFSFVEIKKPITNA